MKKIIISLFTFIMFVNTCVSANFISCSYVYERTDSGKLFYDIAANETTSVLVGKTGRIYCFDSGKWNEIDTGYFDTFEQVEYGTDKFVAVSKDIAIQSTNGKDWTLLSSELNCAENGLFLYADNAFIIERDNGVYRTVDFLTYNKILESLVQSNKIQFYNNDIFYDNKIKSAYDMPEIKHIFDNVFGENNITDTYGFNKKFKLFISLSGIALDAFPVSIDNIAYIEASEDSISVYYVKDGELLKSTTTDFVNWENITIDLPEKSEHLSNIIIGKYNNKYLLIYDTNEIEDRRSKQNYITSYDLETFEYLTVTSIRGDIYSKDSKIYIITPMELYSYENSDFVKQLSTDTVMYKDDIISTDKDDFLWKRDNGNKLYIGKNNTWELVENPDPFLISHYIDGNANYQIIWTGANYLIRPTDYDNGYNPTEAKGTINVYDENLNLIKTIAGDEYILQMSFVNGKCYVLTSEDTVSSLSETGEWEVENRSSLPIGNKITEAYKVITPKESGYGYNQSISSIMNNNIEKKICYENWQGSNVDVINNYYVRYDDSMVSLSSDCVYWTDIKLPSGIRNVKKINIVDNKIIVTTPDVILHYSISDIFNRSKETYVEVNGEILGFDTMPVIENDRTLVPLRFIFETLGAEVDWIADTNTALVNDEDTTIMFSIDNTTAVVNDVSKVMDVPARLINDKTLVPLRFLSEELGFDVEWNEETRTASISK